MTRTLFFAGLAISTAVACGSFGTGSEPKTDPTPLPSAEGGSSVGDGAVVAPDSGPPVVQVTAADGAVTYPFCANQKGKNVVACEDFEVGESFGAVWDFSQKTPGATGQRVGGVPDHGGIASFSLADDPKDCAYHWIQQRRLVDATKINLSFQLRPLRAQETKAAGVVFIEVDEGSKASVVEHYLYVNKFNAAAYYQHDPASKDYQAFGMTLGRWVKIDVQILLRERKILVFTDGALVANHEQIFDLKKATRVNFGIGFVCTRGGGAFDYDDLLVTAE